METIDIMDRPKLVTTMLENYGLISLHLDARVDTVIVPVPLRNTAQLALEIGYNLAVPIPDLTVDERGISATLSFNRQPFFCFIPWKALFAIRVEQNEWAQLIMWKNNVPTNIERTTNNPEKKSSSGLKEQQKPPHLKVVK